MIVSKAWLVRSKVATTFDIGNNWYNKMQTAASFFREVNLSSNAVRYTFIVTYRKVRNPRKFPLPWAVTPYSTLKEATL